MASYDQPIMWQLKEMIHFCEDHKKLYIWGNQHNQKMLKKYLEMCGIKIAGYILSKDRYENVTDVYTVDKVKGMSSDMSEIGILMAVSDAHLNVILKETEEWGFRTDNFYILSEYNKRTISYKMTPRPKERMWIEVNLTDHCNLNCQMCDHFAPLAEPFFLSIESFRKDMERLAELTNGHIDIMKLQGGEPLLNESLIEFIKITRTLFPETTLFLFTDGLLLKKWENHRTGNLWKVFHDYKVKVEFTVYPIKVDVDGIKNLAKKYDVHLDCFTEVGDRNYQGVKHSVKHPFDLSGKVEKWQFISCYQFNESITLRNGKLYTCPMIPYIDIFNKFFHQELEVSDRDYIDIYQAESYEELAEFVTRRTDFCRYCKVMDRRPFEWKQSEHTLDEYVD